MTSLTTATLRTLIYLDICDFAPTLFEMHRYLLRTEENATISDIEHVLAADTRIHAIEGYYVLPGREHLIERRKAAYMYTEEKWYTNRSIFWLLSILPGVKGIWLCNTLGWGNARAQSDTDLCIVAQEGYIWTARAWSTLLLKLLRRRPGECSRERAICPSFYIIDTSEDLGQYRLSDTDIHYAFWLTQMTPLYNTALFQRYGTHQQWARTFFTHDPFVLTTQRRAIILSPFTETIKKLLTFWSPESLLKRIQLWLLPKEAHEGAYTGVVVLNDDILKLHTHDTRMHMNQRYADACHSFNV